MESKKDKYKRTLTDLVKSNRFIPGIYNYCDRWCERCTMTSKCLTYGHEQAMREDSDDPETNDLKNEKFWEKIRLSFEVVRDLIEEDAKRLNIDIDNLPDVEQKEPEKKPVEILAETYSKNIFKWLTANEEKLKQKSEELLLLNQHEENVLKFADAWEVVQWYSLFISAKVHRAHFELEERTVDVDDEFNLYNDNLGSAKIAIIGISRSIEALSTMYSFMPENEDLFIDFLVQLERIKKLMLSTFPEVTKFKRPGFDD